jgi:UDP-N-acetylmuramate--alanine ligase
MTRVHFIGIGGSGLSAIARLLQESGYTVTGSDRAFSPFVADLQGLGIRVHIGHQPENVVGAEMVVRSSAVLDDNPEVIAARAAGIPVLKRADFLGQLMQGKTGIAVAGTHGKTTTTAMLAWVLTALKQEPSFIVGGVLTNLGVNACAGKGQTFVIEADEYDRMFLGLKPVIEVVTNVEHDHPDCYPTPEDFFASFLDFVRLLPADGLLVACADDRGAARLAEQARQLGTQVATYGLMDNKAMTTVARKLTPNEKGGFTFEAVLGQKSFNVALMVPGRHNVLNALAVLTVCDALHLPLVEVSAALGQFSGTGRRFELRGQAGGVTVYDDYAHHPTEIRATLAAARTRHPGQRIWAVWQPHTYSRTQTLFEAFTRAFEDADEVIVTEIYRAREPQQDFSALEVVQAMPHPSARFIAELSDVSDYLVSCLRPGDVLLVLSAGDAEQVSAQVLHRLQKSEVTHG